MLPILLLYLGTSGDMKELRVLQIDDDEDDHLFLSWAVERAGVPMQLHFVSKAHKALELLRCLSESQALPHYILLDVRMPEVSGHELAQIIRAMPELQSVPIVMFTSSNHPADVRMARESGAVAYFEKPTDLATIVTLVKEWYGCWQRGELLRRWPNAV